MAELRFPKVNKKTKYYRLTNIQKIKAKYYIAFGERSNGKTYACLEMGIERYVESGYKKQLGIIRRWDEDLKNKNASEYFVNHLDKIKKLTDGKYNFVKYQSRKWYLAYRNEDGVIEYSDSHPFAIGFTLTTSHHDKSTPYPFIKTILFDEFITRDVYLQDEFITFTNLLSTIIRDNNDVEIYMMGNTVNKYCPYFREMGLRNVLKMKQGTIDTYQYGESGLTVAVEYCNSPNKDGKASDVYFAFDNPKLKMITTGEWELAIYPHLPIKYSYKDDVVLTYFIQFDESVLQCEIISKDDTFFTYIHDKTTPLKNIDTDIVYSTEFNHRPNWRRRIRANGGDKLDNVISKMFRDSKVFYQDNEIGEVVRNYLIWCKNSTDFT